MRVLVAGGTGLIGAALCESLVDRGHEVTALARSPGAASLPAGVEQVAADVTDREAIAEPVAEHDAVANMVALSPLYQQPPGAHEQVTFGAVESLLHAAEAGQTDRFLQLSALGADPDAPTRFLRAKGRADALLREASVTETIVRPSIVFGEGDEIRRFTNQVTTPYVTALPAGGRTPFQPIWVGDLAPLIATALEDGDHEGETFEIGGPEVLMLAEITRAVHRSKGRWVRILPVPMPLSRLGLTVLDPVPLVPFGRDQARALGVTNTVSENDVSTLGGDPETLLTFAEFLDIDSH